MSTLRLSIIDAALSLPIRDDINLLEQCLSANLAVARSCRNGNCGRCDSTLLKGRVQLRNGLHVEGPATIALCISHAQSDVQISQLPLVKSPSHWRCQWQSPAQLRLPAGRQIPPRKGDICAILFEDTVELNEVADISGRDIHLLNACTNSPANQSVSLITIDRDHRGQYALWREHQHQRQTLWTHINHATAVIAQAAYQQNTDGARYCIEHMPKGE